ncbi:PilZ domain-containing protein [Brevibacillus ginsengisoli]|uniref:PilZ domain-containing protein n=1 Tax=Brevibacillus ginsengisoli TaxID=363854 RepID=UPI003CED0FD4
MLDPFIQDKLLQRGLTVRFANSRLVGPPLDGIIEHASGKFLVISFERSTPTRSLVGSTIRMDLDTVNYTVQIQLEVVNEQNVLPVHLLGLTPIHIDQEMKVSTALIKPDYIINVPYKVMGAKPNEEHGEGVILEIAPDKLIMGTDGYVAVGDFINLSFIVPKSKEQFVAMAQVLEKRFENGSSKVTLQFINLDGHHGKLIEQYYNRTRKK